MGLISDFLNRVVDVSYQNTILKESNLSEEEFNETISEAKRKIMLKPNEHIIYHDFTKYMEPRAVREYVGGRGGIRIAKGVWIGGLRGRAESHYELRLVDYGTLTITNQRLIFMGKFKSQTLKLGQISFVKPYTDAIEIAKEGRQHLMYFFAEAGALPFLALRNVDAYNKLKDVFDFFKFLSRIGKTIDKEINFSGTFKHEDTLEICKYIDKVAKNIKNDFNKNKINLKSLHKLNLDVEKLIVLIGSISKTLKSTVIEVKKIEKDYMKIKAHNKSKGIFSKFFHSDSKEVEKIFKEKYGMKPREKIEKAVSDMNDFLRNEFPDDIKEAALIIEKEFAKIEV